MIKKVYSENIVQSEKMFLYDAAKHSFKIVLSFLNKIYVGLTGLAPEYLAP